MRKIRRIISFFLISFFAYCVLNNLLNISGYREEISKSNISQTEQTNGSFIEMKNEDNYIKCSNEVLSKAFKNITITDLNNEEIKQVVRNHCFNNTAISCVPPVYHGRIAVQTNILNATYKKDLQFVQHGGWWSPSHCTARKTVAIIIPFRKREEHLPILLYHLHPILKRQQLHYRMFVIEQDDNYPFNKGQLYNAGVLEVLKLFPYMCLVFQDIDLIPEDDRIDYSCKKSPMHLAGLVDKFKYKLHSKDTFGGVVSFAPKDYMTINGFSNLFWVWGGEDDNLFRRVVSHKMKSTRENLTIARYTMLKHVNRERTRSKEMLHESFRILESAGKFQTIDGLNSVEYHVTGVKVETLYTLIKVNVRRTKLDLILKQSKMFKT